MFASHEFHATLWESKGDCGSSHYKTCANPSVNYEITWSSGWALAWEGPSRSRPGFDSLSNQNSHFSQSPTTTHATEIEPMTPGVELGGWINGTNESMVPENLIKLVTCNCAASMCTGRCACKNNDVCCIDLCRCEATKDQCMNLNNSPEEPIGNDEKWYYFIQQIHIPLLQSVDLKGLIVIVFFALCALIFPNHLLPSFQCNYPVRI